MPRKQPQPFFRKSTQSWYVQLDGRQIALGRDYEKAFEKYHGLMLNRQAIPLNIRVQEVLGIFLSWCEGHREIRTYHWYRDFLKSFSQHIGSTLTLANLKPHHVEGWIDARYGKFSRTYQNGAVRAVMRPMNWLVKAGHIPSNPIVGVERPAYEPREVYISPDQWIKEF